jgi:protein tyrosine phosphatase (PTP) superfamily phosphohydrolase (DUF442 family)
MRRRQVIRAALALLILPPVAYLAWNLQEHNFGVIEPGRVYRSGQMCPDALRRVVRDHRVKTVLNLRGSNPKHAWYREELAATTGAGATQVDVALSSCEWMSRDQLRALVRVLDTCDYPLLIHCQWGSERTGMVSAFATLLRPGGTLDEAKRQFSLRYLYMPVGDGTVTAAHLHQYAGWLRDKGWSHTPDRFREWAGAGFVPGVPSREQWPYDPFPLVVVNPPAHAKAGVSLKR